MTWPDGEPHEVYCWRFSDDPTDHGAGLVCAADTRPRWMTEDLHLHLVAGGTVDAPVEGVPRRRYLWWWSGDDPDKPRRTEPTTQPRRVNAKGTPIQPTEQETNPMPSKDLLASDPLLAHYAQQYADRVGVTLEAAVHQVNAMPSMQALLGRTDAMDYAAACHNANITVPDSIPEAAEAAEPAPAADPPTEVEPIEVEATGPEVIVQTVDTLVPGDKATEPEPELEPVAEVVEAPEPVAEVEAPEPVAEVVELHPTNTLVTLTYRADTTATATTVLAGPPNPDDAQRIVDRLEHGMWLVPEQVGLPQPRTWDRGRNDHGWVEVAITATADKATTARSLADLAEDVETTDGWHPTLFANEKAA